MVFPDVGSGMEKAGQLSRFWIDSGQIRPFVQIALAAGQREIHRVITPAMGLSHDVLDMEKLIEESLRDLAVFAPSQGPIPHEH
jgi:hypothetical protein